MKNEGVGSLAIVRIWYRTMVIDVCLFFYGPSFLQRISVSCL
jgi:hypothetical protein